MPGKNDKNITEHLHHSSTYYPTLPNINNPYITASTSDNTRKAYRQDIRHFITWGGLLPTTPDVIMQYLQAHASILNSRTIARRLIALKNWHIYQGFIDPTAHAAVKKTCLGIQRIHGKPKDKAPALGMEQLVQMVSYLKAQQSLAALRNSALLQLGFFGAFRRSELIQIKLCHLEFLSQGLEIQIPHSKTDQFHVGQVCAIPYGNELLCPITALQKWLEVSRIKEGAIFRRICHNKRVSEQTLSAQSLNLIIKSIAKACELPQAAKYSSHSLRRGFATSASQRGVSFPTLMRHGRWKNERTVFEYIEEGQRFEDNAAKMILHKL